MNRHRTYPALVFGAGLALAVAGCGGDDDGPTSPPPGGGGPTWNSGTLNQGETFQRVFNEEGSWDYRCTFHAGMTGTVTVAPATTNPLTVTVTILSGPFRFSPANVTVRTGGTVTWDNQGGADHNAVRP